MYIKIGIYLEGEKMIYDNKLKKEVVNLLDVDLAFTELKD